MTKIQKRRLKVSNVEKRGLKVTKHEWGLK